MPSGDQVGRIGLAVSHSDSDKVYALIDNREHIRNGAAQVYRSLDGGGNWNRTHETDQKFFSRIGWYFADIYVSPQNDDEIFALGVRLAHSTDGGKSFDFLGGDVNHVTPSSASGMHLDHCELWIHPTNPNHIVLGNDGGLYQSFDKGASWVHFNNIPAGEFYDIAVDQELPYRIFAGAQDNATVFGTSRELNPDVTDDWKYLWIDPWNGGDGCVTLVDPDDSNTVYFSAQEGAFRRKNMTSGRSQPIRPQSRELDLAEQEELKFNFVAPMIISPHESNTLYLGGNYICKSTNRGDAWSVISPDIAKPGDERRRSIAATTVEESPLKSGLIYAGTDKGAMWVSEDGGGQWMERSQNLPIGYVRSISASRFSESRAYVAVTGLNDDDFGSYLYCTQDCGVSWKSLSANLPNEPANVIREDPFHEDILYCGTFRGVYVSMNRGESWSLLGRNLPACCIADLEIHERERDLIVGTHGRGIYKVNLRPLHECYLKDLSSGSSDYLFPVPTFKRPYLSDVRPGLNFRGVEKEAITFWMHEPGPVKLSVRQNTDELADGEAQLLVTLEMAAAKGLNQFHWDLALDQTDSAEPYFINYKTYLGTGHYRVQLETNDGVVLKRDFEVIDDPDN